MLATMMLPSIITLIPTFLIWRSLELIDTYDPLVQTPSGLAAARGPSSCCASLS